MPASFLQLARGAADADFPGFSLDACLINRYEPGTRMTLHQDNEKGFDQPIVSLSLGLAAVFLYGGDSRSDRPARVRLEHGEDVAVWGGPSRLRYHGVMPLKDGLHPILGARRINLTFRKAG